MHSNTSKPLDTELSLSIAKSIKSKAKSCFDNVYQAVLVNKEAIYVQGFIAFPGSPYKPIEHSWLETEASIIDPTLPHLGKSAEDLHYFPAHRLTIKQLKAAIEEAAEDYPDDDVLPVYGDSPYAYYGDLMLGGNEYLEAHQAAEAKCRELNKPKPSGNN
ncbi:MAG: hypothetical protein HC770_13190 [Pseudanabaena sp. CRU_2_10]|nr:hypothetical protein [Pseudanabaena sp. CRU_2_10]